MLQYLQTTWQKNWQKIASALAIAALLLLLWANPTQAATLPAAKTPAIKADPAYL